MPGSSERARCEHWHNMITKVQFVFAGTEVNRVLAAGQVPVERGFAHLKNWRILTKFRADPARATHLFRVLLVLTNFETTTGN